jgi:hypothetical protein
MARPCKGDRAMANLTEPIRSRPAAPIPIIHVAALAALAIGWAGALFLLGGPGLAPVLGRVLGFAPAVLVTLAICLLPGLALVRWLWGERLAWPERLALAGGLGAGLPPLLLMAVHLLRLPWGAWQTAAVLVVALVALLVPRARTEPRLAAPAIGGWISAALIGLLLAGLVVRLLTVADLLVGANVDSYHHTLIAQLLVERGGLFSDWQPYAPLTSFTYHYGFHACVAFVHWLTGMPIPGLLPVVGQTLGAAIIPAVYTLTTRMTGRPAAGLWAALLAGFVNTQPAYYAFWGRYPFIASHLLLVAALICWLRVLDAPRLARGPIALAILASAALAYTHYQTTVLAALFIGSLVVARLLRAPDWRSAGALVGRAALIGIAALMIAMPWLVNTFSGELDRNVAFSSAAQSGEQFPGVALLPVVPFYIKGPVMALGLAGLLVALRRRDGATTLLAVWAMLNELSSLPYLFGLPGTGIIDSAVAPMPLYLTVAPLAGYGLAACLPLERGNSGWIAALPLPERWRSIAASLLLAVSLAAVALVSAWGIGWQRTIVPAYARVVTPADARAIAWVREHTPPDARFLVNSHPIYGGLMLIGTDAGLWLPLLAGREVTVPPLPYGSEVYAEPDYALRAQALAELLRRSPLADQRPRPINAARQDVVVTLREAGVAYVFLGAQPLRGPGALPDVDRIDPGTLRQSADFRLVYDEGGVTIFEMLR